MSGEIGEDFGLLLLTGSEQFLRQCRWGFDMVDSEREHLIQMLPDHTKEDPDC